MKNQIKILLLLILALTLLACNSEEAQVDSGNNDTKTIKIGTMSTVEATIDMLAEGLKDKGYNIETVIFDGNHLPAVALGDDQIDGVILNHKPWLENFNKENNTKLVMPEPYMYHSRIDMYSEKYESVEEIPNGATIVVPGDPVNLDRSLNVLSESGFITLKEENQPPYNLTDIEENIKDIKIVEAEVTATVRSIKDADAIIAAAANVKESGFDHNSELFKDPRNKDFPLGLIVREEDQDAEWVKAIHEYQKSDEFKKKFNENYDGAYVVFD